MAGKTFEEIIEQCGSADPEDQSQQALSLITDLDPRAPVGKIRRIAKQALALDENCFDAWEVLASTERRPDHLAKLCHQAIALARLHFAEEIAQVQPGNPHVLGLWGHMAARPFLCLYETLYEIQIARGELDAAQATLEEMLALNPSDNQGMRDRLLPLLMVRGELEKTRLYLSHYDDDVSLVVMFTSWAMRVFSVLPSLGLDPSDKQVAIELAQDRTRAKAILASDTELESASQELAKRSPLLFLVLTSPHPEKIPLPDTIRYRGVDEAISQSKNLLLITEANPIIKSLLLSLPWPRLEAKTFPEQDIPWLRQLNHEALRDILN